MDVRSCMADRASSVFCGFRSRHVKVATRVSTCDPKPPVAARRSPQGLSTQARCLVRCEQAPMGRRAAALRPSASWR